MRLHTQALTLPSLLLALLGAGASAFAQTPAAPRLETVVEGLESPWAMAFLPSGKFLISERPGRLHIASPGGKPGPALLGLPAVDAVGQGGLLDVQLDSDFARNRTVYFCFNEPDADKKLNGTALARARLSEDETRLEAPQVIFRQNPKMAGRHHYGCRIVEAPDGKLFLTLGERFAGMQRAQTLDNHLGKVVRIGKDGSVPADNPFAGRPGALPEIWSYGHRNPQGATLDGQGQLWLHEHGPQGGDELNRVVKGRNYGWPVITYGENYGGGKIGEGLTAKEGMEQPVAHWVHSIAPSGLTWLNSARYGADWQGSFFIGALKFRHLERVKVSAGEAPQVQARGKVIDDVGRLRDVREGPDGLLYLLTENPGRVLRVAPPAR
ncbi:PQQ-dependent sugar dehydrogenase [Roseateles sp.]|jgi:glucose/arabinose dehydrogenase|uniref:PQQ-dependent sugar dehydrogenase n=1 Tax=Roseateles sp. TaxID=1971397 RepID=UPI0037C713CB